MTFTSAPDNENYTTAVVTVTVTDEAEIVLHKQSRLMFQMLKNQKTLEQVLELELELELEQVQAREQVLVLVLNWNWNRYRHGTGTST